MLEFTKSVRMKVIRNNKDWYVTVLLTLNHLHFQQTNYYSDWLPAIRVFFLLHFFVQNSTALLENQTHH